MATRKASYNGKLADPTWRHERARKAGIARMSLDAYVARIVRDAPKLTPEHLDKLRGLFGFDQPCSCGQDKADAS